MQLDKIQYDSPKVPELIMEAIVNAIGEGKIKVGKELPPERDLAEQLGVGRGALRGGLAILELKGTAERRGN
jgi:GntR family transcriptional repressor for pyruvate dehydrogenase complex